MDTELPSDKVVSNTLRSMKKLLYLALTMGLVTAIAPHVRAVVPGETLDQFTARQGGGLAPVSDLSIRAQTFTVGRSGLLTRVDLSVVRLQLGSQNLTTEDLRFSVTRPTSSTLPVGATLASFTLHPNQVPTPDYPEPWLTFDLSASPIPVTVGEVFSLRLDSNQSYFSDAFYGWYVNIALPVDYYPRGAGWQKNNITDPWFQSPPTEDYWFRTYVSPVPEPSLLTLLSLGAMTLLLRRSVAKQQ